METKHYICLGECEGVSSKPGVCQSVECDNYNQSLVTCTCTDGEHNRMDSEESFTEEEVD